MRSTALATLTRSPRSATTSRSFGCNCASRRCRSRQGRPGRGDDRALYVEIGSPDILVNNAGIQFVSPVADFPPEKWDSIIAINLTAVFHTTRLALPGMRANGWGRVINTASAHSLVASPNKSAYVAAKHGVAGFTKTVALETARDGITVNCISPGYVWTTLVENQIPDTMKARASLAASDQRRASRGATDKRVVTPKKSPDWRCIWRDMAGRSPAQIVDGRRVDGSIGWPQ